MEDIYLYSWEKELKSTYYCFIDKGIKGEKYTSQVNKRGERKGFGKREPAVLVSEESAPVNGNNLKDNEMKAHEKFGDQVVDEVMNSSGESCPTDPLLAKLCPSCE
jgi:ribonucleoside-diphosphate reductase alpha chain